MSRIVSIVLHFTSHHIPDAVGTHSNRGLLGFSDTAKPHCTPYNFKNSGKSIYFLVAGKGVVVAAPLRPRSNSIAVEKV